MVPVPILIMAFVTLMALMPVVSVAVGVAASLFFEVLIIFLHNIVPKIFKCGYLALGADVAFVSVIYSFNI